jgi:hypothetical protein
MLARRIDQILSGIRPLPVHGALDKSPADRIMVQIVDGGRTVEGLVRFRS